MTISDVGVEEWLEVPAPCDPESQIPLDLSGPEQWPMEPMPPCMEFFQVEIFSVMMKCTLIIFQPSLRFQSSPSRYTVNISALPQPTCVCGPSPHLVASLSHPSTARCRLKSSVDPADHWPSNLLLKACLTQWPSPTSEVKNGLKCLHPATMKVKSPWTSLDLSSGQCRQKSSVDLADLCQSNLLLKAP